MQQMTMFEDERMRLYKLGYTDRQIARLTHYSDSAICRWRMKYGLTSNGRVRKIMIRGDDDGKRGHPVG